MWMISSIVSFLFPPVCIGCGKAGVPFCDQCIKLSRKALATPQSYIVSFFDFKDPMIKRAIHALKYYHRKDIVPLLAHPLALELQKLPEIKSYTLIPIPMPRWRKLFRGYNQAELIAQALSKSLGISVRTDLLHRANTPTRQVTVHTKEARLKNQIGSFSVASAISEMSLIIIDDVTTTGATIEEARKLLLKKGARSVRAATLAH